jgi:hypothetical protein
MIGVFQMGRKRRQQLPHGAIALKIYSSCASDFIKLSTCAVSYGFPASDTDPTSRASSIRSRKRGEAHWVNSIGRRNNGPLLRSVASCSGHPNLYPSRSPRSGFERTCHSANDGRTLCSDNVLIRLRAMAVARLHLG